jgi:hypothetical protein
MSAGEWWGLPNFATLKSRSSLQAEPFGANAAGRWRALPLPCLLGRIN